MEIKSAEGASHIGGVIDICLTFHFALDISTLTFKTITYFFFRRSTTQHNTQTTIWRLCRYNGAETAHSHNCLICPEIFLQIIQLSFKYLVGCSKKRRLLWKSMFGFIVPLVVVLENLIFWYSRLWIKKGASGWYVRPRDVRQTW